MTEPRVDRRPRSVSYDQPPLPLLAIEPLELVSDDCAGSEAACSGRCAYSYSRQQGIRRTNEDALILGAPTANGWHLWGILDGHGGRQVADYLVTAIPKALRPVCEASAGRGERHGYETWHVHVLPSKVKL